MAQLEGGVAAVGVASGQSAQFLAISALAGAGDNIVATCVSEILFIKPNLSFVHLDLICMEE